MEQAKQVTHEVLVDGAVVVECCEARVKELTRSYEVQVIRYCSVGLVKGRHCGMGCLYKEE